MATRAKLDGNAKYLEKLDRVVIRLHKDGSDGLTKEQLEGFAADSGQSVNQLIIDAIKDKFL